LATGELVLRTAEGLDGGSAVCVTSADGEDDLANVDTGDGAVGLTESTTHTSLQSIGTSTRQHLVDADDVVRVGTDAHVETFLSGNLDEVPCVVLVAVKPCASNLHDVLVCTNTGSLKSFGAHLFVLVGDEVNAERELIDTSTLAAKVEDSDLGVGYTTVETRLRVRL
jgi:hypothetical protein